MMIDQMLIKIQASDMFYQRQLPWACLTLILAETKRATVELHQRVPCELFLLSVTCHVWLRLELRPSIIKYDMAKLDYLIYMSTESN